MINDTERVPLEYAQQNLFCVQVWGSLIVGIALLFEARDKISWNWLIRFHSTGSLDSILDSANDFLKILYAHSPPSLPLSTNLVHSALGVCTASSTDLNCTPYTQKAKKFWIQSTSKLQRQIFATKACKSSKLWNSGVKRTFLWKIYNVTRQSKQC